MDPLCSRGHTTPFSHTSPSRDVTNLPPTKPLYGSILWISVWVLSDTNYCCRNRTQAGWFGLDDLEAPSFIIFSKSRVSHRRPKGTQWDHTMLPSTRHRRSWRTHPALIPARQAGTRFTYPRRWKAELTYVTCYVPSWFTRPQTVTHPKPGPVSINYVDQS